ncbi:DUF1294 domain-containing protein [Acuticoccus sp. MNP-M23]|uniref:DUF1294 domain-containing protein n=1 Tax=Acuticoccus sp. MNP-M23 TaxID=3072793 RepID=UPI002814BC7F|nr:DUF1294 domain-containing protein [Acuticoccus sp. MNP-M23]WMS42210.1 DUF1294 domain-containing protein [Acuticoccus sp. MNP-M23]
MAFWLALCGFLLAVNLAGGLVFVADKRAAVADRRRVPERMLLTLAALGASPAMIFLTSRIRHKTRKEPFRTLLRAILGVQIVAIAVYGANAIGLI